MLWGGTSTKNERAAESMQVIEAEIRSLAESGPTEEELDKAKKYLIGSYALALRYLDQDRRPSRAGCRPKATASIISTSATG